MSASPKLQIESNNKLPSERLIEKENSMLDQHVIDEGGRVFKLCLPSALDQADLVAALGKEHSQNLTLLAMYMPLMYIESIDDVKFVKPNNYAELRAAMKRVDQIGMTAISSSITKYQAAMQEKSEDIASIKK